MLNRYQFLNFSAALAILFFVLIPNLSFSQTLFSDDFSGTVGDNLTDYGWTVYSGGVNKVKFSSTSITMSGLQRSGVGNTVSLLAGNYENVQVNFTSQNSGSVYASALVRIKTPSSGKAIFAMGDATSNKPEIWVKSGSAGKFIAGLNKDAITYSYNESVEYDTSKTYLFVLKYEFKSGTKNDPVSLFIFENSTIPSIEPAPTYIDAVMTGKADVTSLYRVILKQQGVGATIDGIRVAKDWASAIGVNQNRSPELTTPTQSSVTSNTASLGGTLTSLGWTSGAVAGTISQRGIVWNTTGNPTLADTKVTSGDGTNTFSTVVNGLPAQTKIYYKAYATNANGTSYSAVDLFYTQSNEPAAHVTGLTGEAETLSSVKLHWDTGNTANGYIILRKIDSDPTGVPADGVAYSVNDVIGDAIVAHLVTNPIDTFAVIEDLVQNTNYHFTVIPYNYDGTHSPTYNYKTGGSPNVTVRTELLNLSSVSDIISDPSFTYSTNFDYKAYQASNITDSNSLEMWRMSIRDGGSGFDDSDTNPTILNSLTLSVTNYSALRSVALYDGSTELAEVAVSSSTLNFTGFNASAADNSSKTLSLRATFQSTVTDQTQFKFTITGATTEATGSSAFVNISAGGASSSDSGNHNRLDVVANHLSIQSQPTNLSIQTINVAVSPAIVVRALDVNNNLDLGYASTVTLTNNGSGVLTNKSVSAVSGVATFSSVTNPTIETSSFTVSSGALTTVTTNTFRFLPVLTTLFTETFNSTATGNSVAYNETNQKLDNKALNFSASTATPGTVGFTATNPSSGYAGVSAGSNMLINSPNAVNSFTIDSINTAVYTNLNLSFGFYSSSITQLQAPNVAIEYSINNGASWSGNIVGTRIVDYQVDGKQTQWVYMSGISIPSEGEIARLLIRFRTTGTGSGANPSNMKFDDIKLSGNYKYASEPTVASSALTISNLTHNSLALNWTSGNGDAHLVVAKQASAVDATPVDAVGYTPNSTFGSGSQLGTGNYVVYAGTGSSVTVSGLTNGEKYYFSIFEYNGSGGSSNYFLTAPSIDATTYLTAYTSNSDVVAVSNSEAVTISSVVNNASPLAYNQGVSVWQFTIRDGGGLNDYDALPTIVQSLKITKGDDDTTLTWASIVKSADLFDGTTHLATASITQDTLYFNLGSPLSVADNSQKTVEMRISLKENPIYNDTKLQFKLEKSGVVVSDNTTSSQLANFTAQQSNNGKNQIRVTATQLVLDNQPTTTPVDSVVTPAIRLTATDQHGNIDNGFTGTVTVLSNNTFNGSSTLSQPGIMGHIVFDDLKFSAENLTTFLKFGTSGLDSVTTNTFMVYTRSTPNQGDFIITQFTPGYNGTTTDVIEIANRTNKYFDLSDLKIEYLDANGDAVNGGGLLSGIAKPNQFNLVASTSSISDGKSAGTSVDHIITEGLSTVGQVALRRVSDNVVIDGLAYGNVVTNVFGKGTPTAALSGKQGLKLKPSQTRINDSNDYRLVENDTLWIANHNSLYIVDGTDVKAGSYPILSINGAGTIDGDVTVAHLLELNSGFLDASSSQVSVEETTTLTKADGWIFGSLKYNLTTPNNIAFPVGDDMNFYGIRLNVIELPNNATYISAKYKGEDPGSYDVLPDSIVSYYNGGSWLISTDGNNATGNYSVSIDTQSLTDYFGGNDITNYTILKRINASSGWTKASYTISYSGSVITASNITGIYEFTIGENMYTVPVEISNFKLVNTGSLVTLKWTTQTETNNYGFEVEHFNSENLTNPKIQWQKIGFIPGHQNSASEHNYTFEVKKEQSFGYYRLKQVDINGSYSYFGELFSNGIADKFELLGNYPNPFNPETTIRFSLPKDSKIRIEVYNILGQIVTTLADQEFKAGYYTVPFNASRYASGVYYYQIVSDELGRSEIKRMTLIK